MCKAMEDLRNESYAEGREEGLLKGNGVCVPETGKHLRRK